MPPNVISGHSLQSAIFVLYKMAHHPSFSLDGYRSIIFTLFHEVLLESLTSKSIETWGVVTYCIDTY